MERVYNFSAGPAVLPQEVLEIAQKELLSYENSGLSVLEMSHRSKAFTGIIEEAEALLRKLMNIPDNYRVLFLQGGASTQFAAVPLNLMEQSGKADYILTGMWAKKAYEQAKAYGNITAVATSADRNFSYIPQLPANIFDPKADYVHLTMNNTIYGTRFTTLPDTGKVPIVSDFSSCILSEACDVKKFGLIYAGAQKNIGPAGVTIVIVRDDLLGKTRKETPIMLNYKTYADNDSLYNTPPTFSIYVSLLVFRWIEQMGGIAEMEKRNIKKATLFYDYLEESTLFSSPVDPKDRSLMNIPFVTGSDELDSAFLKQASANGLISLKGHRAVGGMRASIYNAMPIEGVQALIDCMKDFELNNGGN